MPDRRTAVPFDPDYFARRAQDGRPMTPVEAFRHAYETNLWAGAQSRSGPGASLDQTERIREQLPALCHRLQVGRLLDLPCGDGHWMEKVDLGGVTYIGADLLPELVTANAARNRHAGREFLTLDLTSSALPSADLILCRDCLVHLSFADSRRALANIGAARITYLLTTTFPDQAANVDIATGDWRPLNLERAPFGFPAPLALLPEGCTEGDGRFHDKSLGLWLVAELPEVAERVGEEHHG